MSTISTTSTTEVITPRVLADWEIAELLDAQADRAWARASRRPW